MFGTNRKYKKWRKVNSLKNRINKTGNDHLEKLSSCVLLWETQDKVTKEVENTWIRKDILSKY